MHYWNKFLSCAIVVLMNIYFTFLSIEIVQKRSTIWQSTFCIICTVQLFAEVFLYETVECLWINYIIPLSAYHGSSMHGMLSVYNFNCIEINMTKMKIEDYIKNVLEIRRNRLDSTRYFFVSTKLARKCPELMESALVLGYNQSDPGHFYPAWLNRDHIVLRLLALLSNVWEQSFFLLLLQHIGGVSLPFQRLCIRIIEPIVLGSVLALAIVCIKHPVFAIPPFVVVAVLLTARHARAIFRSKVAPDLLPENKDSIIRSFVDETGHTAQFTAKVAQDQFPDKNDGGLAVSEEAQDDDHQEFEKKHDKDDATRVAEALVLAKSVNTAGPTALNRLRSVQDIITAVDAEISDFSDDE